MVTFGPSTNNPYLAQKLANAHFLRIRLVLALRNAYVYDLHTSTLIFGLDLGVIRGANCSFEDRCRFREFGGGFSIQRCRCVRHKGPLCSLCGVCGVRYGFGRLWLLIGGV